MYILNTRSLIADLANGRVSMRDRAYYLLVGWVLYAVVGYSTLVFSNQGRTWLGVFEAFMLLVITVLGIQSCYEASGGDENANFVVDFTCLLVPLTIKITVVVWGLYWLFAWATLHVISSTTFSGNESVKLVNFLSQNAGWLATLIAVLVSQEVFFLRMRSHMAAIAKLKEASRASTLSIGRDGVGIE